MRAQVLNNCQGPHYVQLPHSDGGKAIGGLIILQPGLNLVDAKQLADLRKNKGFDVLFKTKIQPSKASEADPTKFGKPMLEVVGKELDDGQPFAKLSIEEATGVIQMTQDTDLLAEWLKALKPGEPLVKVINDRVKEIASGLEPSAA